MMREILFRGKRTDSGEWVYGSFIPDLLEVYQGAEMDGFIKPFGKTKEERMMTEADRETVGQFTGLTDKNGKKIFEGDILLGKRKTPYVVRYSQNIAAFVADGMGVLTSPVMNTGTVVGNIYDNPELTEKAEKKEGQA